MTKCIFPWNIVLGGVTFRTPPIQNLNNSKTNNEIIINVTSGFKNLIIRQNFYKIPSNKSLSIVYHQSALPRVLKILDIEVEPYQIESLHKKSAGSSFSVRNGTYNFYYSCPEEVSIFLHKLKPEEASMRFYLKDPEVSEIRFVKLLEEFDPENLEKYIFCCSGSSHSPFL